MSYTAQPSSSNAGRLRAREIRQLQTELGHLEEQEARHQAAKQRRRLSQNSHTSTHTARSRMLQPGDRQLSSGSGTTGRAGLVHLAQQQQQHEDPSSTTLRKRRSPASNASRTSTVLSAGAGAREPASRVSSTTRGEGYLEPPTTLQMGHTASRSQAQLHDSPLRRWCRLVEKTTRSSASTLTLRNWRDAYREWLIALAVIVWIKWAVGLGGWSGKDHPPLYGDLEAQRHWLSITNHLPVSQWYFHDLQYWGLDYPPFTAYHSWFLGKLARTFGDPRWVELKGRLGGKEQVFREEKAILFMRSTVIVGDLLVYALPIAAWCALKLGRWSGGSSSSSSRRSTRTLMTAFYTVMLQPGLIMIDSGHFQYNSIMLGLTVSAVLCFHAGRDTLGAVLFVASMCFKQMAIYYAPAIFGYLLGKCFWLGGNEGLNVFTSLGFFSTAALLLFFSPFLFPLSQLSQAFTRIFPFSRGLFEDKVANAWCSLNVVIKLREIASVQTLARVSAVITLGAVLPIVAGMVWVSWQLGSAEEHSASRNGKEQTSRLSSPAPSIKLLPHALFASSMAFFLFSFQVHEKSILLPLMPLTLLHVGKQPGLAGQDFEWAVLLNNIGSFSMYPLLKRDGLALPTLALTLFWNFALGSNPLSFPSSITKYLTILAYVGCATILFLDSVTSPPAHLPDLFVVLNVLLSCAMFGLGWLWSLKRLVEEAWGLVGLGSGNRASSPVSEKLAPNGNGLVSRSVSEYSIASIASERPRRPKGDTRRVSGDGQLAYANDGQQQQQQQQARQSSGRRSTSVASASSSHTATKRISRRSPMVSPNELPIEEDSNSYIDQQRTTSHLLPPSYSSASLRSNGRRELHHRSPSAGSAGSSNFFSSGGGVQLDNDEAAEYPSSNRRARERGFFPDNAGIPEEERDAFSGGGMAMGDVSTHVSPSKTLFGGFGAGTGEEKITRRSRAGEFEQGQNMKLEEERWRDGMLREFS